MTQTLTQKLVENASNKPGILGTIYEVGAQFLDTISEAGRCWWQLTQAGSEMAQAGYSISKPTLKRRDKIKEKIAEYTIEDVATDKEKELIGQWEDATAEEVFEQYKNKEFDTFFKDQPENETMLNLYNTFEKRKIQKAKEETRTKTDLSGLRKYFFKEGAKKAPEIEAGYKAVMEQIKMQQKAERKAKMQDFYEAMMYQQAINGQYGQNPNFNMGSTPEPE